jgi:hypothetical protein
VTPERRGPYPDVQHNPEHCTSRNPDQLSLRVYELVVKPANNPGSRPAVIILDKISGEAGGTDLSSVIRLEEKPALVAKHPWREQQHSRQLGRLNLHRPRSSRAI